jgi:hypothetical protein
MVNRQSTKSKIDMKTKGILLSSLLSFGLLAGTTAFAAGGNGGNRCSGGSYGGIGPGGYHGNPNSNGTPLHDGSGKATAPAKGVKGGSNGNPNSSGTPLKDGSGKATAPGKGAKDGTGNQANCPNLPKG